MRGCIFNGIAKCSVSARAAASAAALQICIELPSHGTATILRSAILERAQKVTTNNRDGFVWQQFLEV